jgi:hypothetical protein
MRNILQLEGKVSRSRSKHEGESSADICDRPGRTRVRSLRQLPTDHDYAVPTREYQLDQSSLILLRLLLTLSSITKSRSPHLDRSLHINVRVADHSETTASIPAHGVDYVLGKARRSSRSCERIN